MCRIQPGSILYPWRAKGEFRLLTKQKKINLASRFRGLLPIVIDVETSGLDSSCNALLEIAAVTISMDSAGKIYPEKTFHYHVEPFAGAVLDKKALEVTHIDPFQPLRYAIPEQQALRRIFAKIRRHLEATQCNRGVLVGHNAWFDLSFIHAAVARSKIGAVPLHSFTTFDTATLSAVALGETILARAVRTAGIDFDVAKAHSAAYDAEKTAELFCYIVNNTL
jgi:ribonuclease T